MTHEENFGRNRSICPLGSNFSSVSDNKNGIHLIALSRKIINSDSVIEFLENRSPIYKFEYSHIARKDSKYSLGYEIKTVNEINAIYLMLNPDPKKLALIPPNGLIISHHKISCYSNRIYQGMLDQAKNKRFNIYNFHLAWDVMEGGIGDSFLFHLGFKPNEYEKVDLTYKKNRIKRLGAILKRKFIVEDIVSLLKEANVNPMVIYNKQCKLSKIGYIPGGGFIDSMIIEMADYGVDTLISSDPNWTVETIARELDMTLIDINHYISEKYGLNTMKNILSTAFPDTPTIILEILSSNHCLCPKCYCSDRSESLN